MTERLVKTATLTGEAAIALANLLDTEHPDGTLPPLWHTVYLLDAPRQSELGADGHPVRGFPSPPAPNMRRMFAGGRVRTFAPLLIGACTTRTTQVVATVEKDGRSGKLVFVTVRHSYEQDGNLKVEAEDDIVYRPEAGHRAPATTAPAIAQHADPTSAQPPAAELLLSLRADSRLLFRYSALTYNAHRIHYDRAWCEREGYSGLVIHGPLQALLIAEALRQSGRSLVGNQLSYRLVSPLVGEQRVSVYRADRDRIFVTGENGLTTASATVTACGP